MQYEEIFLVFIPILGRQKHGCASMLNLHRVNRTRFGQEFNAAIGTCEKRTPIWIQRIEIDFHFENLKCIGIAAPRLPLATRSPLHPAAAAQCGGGGVITATR
jgi:hypothetical protein